MKTTFTKIVFSLFLLMFTAYSFAQIPQAFNYQAVARDVSGNVLPNQLLGIRVSLHLGTATGVVVYSETFTPTTNAFGLFTIGIGIGIPVSGQFDTIAWGKNHYYMQVEMDPTGGATYADMGTSQLLSVPYAMYAENSVWKRNGSDIFYDNGFVGIGTSSPQVRLHVMNNMRIDGAMPLIQFRDGTTAKGFIQSWGSKSDLIISNNVSSGSLQLWTNYTERMRIDSLGNVGIGTASPVSGFHIKQKIANEAIRFEHESNSNFWNIGIGTSTLNCRFEYNGTGKGQISSVDGTYSTLSDKRLKKDITKANDLLDKVNKLNVYEFYYMDQEAQGLKTRGFIAQEVEEIFPDLVKVSDEGYKLITYSNFSVVAIKAIQEQQKEIELLKTEIELLKQKIIILQGK